MTRPAGNGFSWAEDGGANIATPGQSLVDLGYAPGSPAEPLTLNDGLRQIGLWTQYLAALQPESGVPRRQNCLPAGRVLWVRSVGSGSIDVDPQPGGGLRIEYSGGAAPISGALILINIGALVGTSRSGSSPLLQRLRVRLAGIQAGATNIEARLLSRSTQFPAVFVSHATTAQSVGTSDQYLVADDSEGSIGTPELYGAGEGAAFVLEVDADLDTTDAVFFLEIFDLDTTNEGIA